MYNTLYKHRQKYKIVFIPAAVYGLLYIMLKIPCRQIKKKNIYNTLVPT